MVTISKMGGIKYYVKLGVEDYYVAGGEPNGIWTGLGTLGLGLKGEVSQVDLHRLMNGFSLQDLPLCEGAGTDRHRPGWDICFSPPKSVSVAFARAPVNLRHQISKAHFLALRDALRHLEKHAAVTRRGHDGVTREFVSGLVMATFEHSTSREMDPQLHTHALIFNVAPRHDGSWGSLESRDLYLWRRSADAVNRPGFRGGS